MHFDPSPRWPLFGALVAGGALVAAFAYFVLSDRQGEAVPASGGTYVEGVLRPPERINPLFAAANQTDADLSALIFSGLVRLGPDGTPLPDLAERWEITGNGQSYVLHLRRGVVWHDGDAFDADDVLFTFRAISDPAFRGDPTLAQLMQGVVLTARDAYTVEFRLEQAYAPFLAYLTVGILPHHLLEGLDANGLLNAPFNGRPIGTGPYRLRGRDDDSIELAPHSTYYFGPPRIEKIELRFFASPSAVAEALRRGEIDAGLFPPATDPSVYDILRDAPGILQRNLVSTSFFMLYLDTRSPMFSDAAVRRAMLRGMNMQSVIDGPGLRRGMNVESGMPESLWAYSDLDVPGFDPGAAASLLEQAGWRRGRDGVRTKGADRLSFTLDTADDPYRVEIAENISRQLRALGIDVTVQPLDRATFVDQHLISRSYTAALALVDPGPDPDPYPFWHSSQIGPPGRNLANYSEPRIDDVLERARQTTDTERRKELYALFSGYLIAAMPSIPLFAPTYTYVQPEQLQGVAPGMLFTPASRFANVHEWYLQTRVR